MEYRSKVDWGTVIALLTGIGFAFNWVMDLPDEWLSAVPALALVLVFGFIYPVRYQTEGDALVLQAGAIRRRRIPYTDITRIAPSENARGTYALSKDKLVVEHRGKTTAVSPDEQERFLADIAMRCPQLSQDGNELRAVLT